MRFDIDEAMAAGLDIDAIQKAENFFAGLREPGPDGEVCRLFCLRALADLARENTAARSVVVELLDAVAGKLPVEAETFRAYYLEGNTKPSAREVGRKLYMCRTTVFDHTKRIFTAMFPLAFGPEFEEKPKPPKERAEPKPKRPRKRATQYRRVFFALLDDVSRLAYTYKNERETAQEAARDRKETAGATGEE